MGASSSVEDLKNKYIPNYDSETRNEHETGKPKSRFVKYGIKLTEIKKFIDVDCGGEANLDGLSTRDVVARFIVPLTTDHTNHNHGYSYINWRHKKDDTLSQTAEVYVIHAWDAMFLDVFESLLEYENREKERLLVLKERQDDETYFSTTELTATSSNSKEEESVSEKVYWIDAFVVNYHKSTLKHHIGWFSKALVNGISSMSRVVVVFANWTRPMVYERTWAMLEIYTTLLLRKKVEIALSDKNLIELQEEIKTDSPITMPYTYLNKLSKIDICDSSSFLEKHKYMIMKHISQWLGPHMKDNSLVGFDPIATCNTLIRDYMKDWVIQQAGVVIDQIVFDLNNRNPQYTSFDYLKSVESLANIYRFDGRATEALVLYGTCDDNRDFGTIKNLNKFLEAFKNRMDVGANNLRSCM